jgi:hypothetical protein
MVRARLVWYQAFFYAHAGGQIVFSNTLEAVRVAPVVSAKLDLHFIGDSLLQSWCPDAERTAFRDIRRLPAGLIARAAVERFPHLFRVQDDAFRRVSLLADKFSR